MRIILKYTPKEIGRDRENESFYLSINRSRRLFGTQKLTFGFHKGGNFLTS